MVEEKFFQISGVLWLDWVNTQAVSGSEVTELVRDFADLVAWLQRFEVISTREQRELKRWTKSNKHLSWKRRGNCARNCAACAKRLRQNRLFRKASSTL
jgi:hypothetical protein